MYKILIVEDEEMIRKGLRYTFDWYNSDCVVIDEASNGLEGLEKIETLEPDIVVADITMPIMDGITMLEKSTEKFLYSAIIISGYDEFEYAKRSIKIGVAEYLLKPVEPEQLFEALKRAKDQINQRRQFEFIKNSTINIEDIYTLNMDLIKDSFHISKHVSYMINYIMKNYSKKISIKDLVATTGMSDTYLNQKFKEETSFTFNEFLNRYRIQEAINIMKTGEGKVYTIASDVGFNDYRYFISVFKKYTNCTPSDFLKYFKNRNQK